MALKSVLELMDNYDCFKLYKGDCIGIFRKDWLGIEQYLEKTVTHISCEDGMIAIALKY